MREPATYPTTVWNGLSDNTQRTDRNDDAPPDSRDWDRLVSEVIAAQTELSAQIGVNGVPKADTATGSPHSMYVLANSSGNTWMDLEFAMQSIIADNTAMDNRYESFYLDPMVAGVVHGTPVRLYRTVAAKGTGASDDAVLTANTAIETAAYANWILTVVESPTGNRTSPVTVVDTPNATVTCTVPNSGLTTWNAIVTSWNAAQTGIVADLATGNYDAATTTTGNSTIQIGADGVLDEVRITTMNLTANAVEATVFGLAYNGTANTTTGNMGTTVLVQTAGTMTFTAEQTVNTVNNALLDTANLMVPGEAYYASVLMENEPEAANAYCSPVGLVTSPTTLRLRLGLPMKATVGA